MMENVNQSLLRKKALDHVIKAKGLDLGLPFFVDTTSNEQFSLEIARGFDPDDRSRPSGVQKQIEEFLEARNIPLAANPEATKELYRQAAFKELAGILETHGIQSEIREGSQFSVTRLLIAKGQKDFDTNLSALMRDHSEAITQNHEAELAEIKERSPNVDPLRNALDSVLLAPDGSALNPRAAAVRIKSMIGVMSQFAEDHGISLEGGKKSHPRIAGGGAPASGVAQ